MDQSEAQKSDRIILSPEADEDLAEIHVYTTGVHGLEQADKYLDFLFAQMGELVADRFMGLELEQLPGLFASLVKWPKARHGHRIIYRRSEGFLIVIRILHTSMNLSDHVR